MKGRSGDGKRRVSVLFTSAGRRVQLLHSFRHDAEALGVELRIVACDLESQWSAACSVADAAFDVPAWDDPGYVDAVRAICRREDVDLVIPTVDPELLPFSLAAEHFRTDGSIVLVSCPAVVRMARDKALTMQTLRLAGLPVPHTCSLEEAFSDAASLVFPLVAKPRDGSASSGLTIVQDPDALERLDPHRQWILQERLQGQEFTVNMLFDARGALVAAVPHQRRQIRAGEVEKGVTVRHHGLLACAQRLAEAMTGARGALCFQAFVDDEERIGIFEINARFGGGYPLSHAAGAAFGRHMLAAYLGLPLPDIADWREGVVMLRYDWAVFR